MKKDATSLVLTTVLMSLTTLLCSCSSSEMTMPEFTFTLGLDANNRPVWSPRPRDQVVHKNDNLHFKSEMGQVHIEFTGECPFDPNPIPAPRFTYESRDNKPLDLTVTVTVQRQRLFPFNCAVRIAQQLIGLDNAGDDINVGP